jgi:cytochrome c peroxidase
MRGPLRFFLVFLALVAFSACGGDEDHRRTDAADPLRETADAMFGVLDPVPAAAVGAPDATLGRGLFWDARLSRDGGTACASCHTQEAWGSDARPRSTDARGRLTSRHSQTVFNITLQPALRWLADRQSPAEQAHGSITGSMGFGSPEDIVPLLEQFGYAAAFRAAYPEDDDPVTPRRYGDALEAYQATLVTPAPFDAWLAGDDTALTAGQREGLELFTTTGCVSCHSGPLFGGTVLQRFGVMEDYWTATGSTEIDEGRFAMSGDEGDRYVFRTPMLRNIEHTAPYFHDGSVERLDDAVRIMARVQLGRTLDDTQVERIVDFLRALSGDVPDHYAPPSSGVEPGTIE